MSTHLRGYTAVGQTLGAMTPVKGITFPATTQTLERLRSAGDANDAGTALYNDYSDGPVRVTFRENVTLRNALIAKAKAGTTDTFTFNKTGRNKYSGAGFVQEVGEVSIVDNEPEFTVTFEPETEWTVAVGT